MRNKMNGVTCVATLAFWIFSASAARADFFGDRGQVYPGPTCSDSAWDSAGKGKGKGGELPDPLTVYNQRVELAPGELYLLVGTLRYLPVAELGSHSSSKKLQTRPFLEVDFKAHPWLASERRQQAPFYELLGTADLWKAFDGQKVTIGGRASQYVVEDRGDLKIHTAIWVIPEACTVPDQP